MEVEDAYLSVAYSIADTIAEALITPVS